jgi:multidrug efflux pump subunit AcrA (membrane-fusion protein)
MLTRISLFVVFLAGIGAIVFGQMQIQQKIKETIADRTRFYNSWQDEERKRIAAETELASTREQLAQTQAELNRAQQEISNRDAQIAQLNIDLERTNGDLRRARAERDAAQARVVQYELTGLEPDEVKEVIARLTASLENIEALELTIDERDSTIDVLEGKLAELIGSDAPVILPAGLKGKVMTVDPKWDFVVIDLGKEDGLLINGQMLVSRNGKLLAKVRIVNVMEDSAIANVMAGWKLDEILEGDTVLY